jgi:fatty acid desaturase
MDQINHGQLMADLAPSEREGLLQQSNAPGLARLTGHLGAIVLLGAAIVLRVPYWPLLMLPQGILIAFLFCPLHEAVHRTAFRSDRLNAVTAHLAGFLKLMSPRWFGYFHNAHHAYTQDPERDPELATPKPQTLGQYLFYLTGLTEWTSRIRILLTNAAGQNADSFVPDRARNKVTRQARIYLGLYGALIGLSLLAGSTALLWAWVIPALIGQPFLRAYLLAEHGLCPYVASMLENTRTTFTTRLVRLIAWNMPYHAEHHAQPSVPFHKLPDLHALARTKLRVTQNGYLAFQQKYLTAIECGDTR